MGIQCLCHPKHFVNNIKKQKRAPKPNLPKKEQINNGTMNPISTHSVANVSNALIEEEEEFNHKSLLLCHFCERDGPSVLFCTQIVHHSLKLHTDDTNKNTTTIDTLDGNETNESVPSVTERKEENSGETMSKEHEFVKRILKIYQKEILLCNIKHATLEGNELFVSSHRIKHPHTSKFKSLSLRSLSVEYVGPGREGPVLFGDETTGYNLAYVFKLKDSKARGFTRWYSFILMDKTLSCLTLSWSFVQKAFSHVVKMLKKRSQEVFLQESKEQTNNTDNAPMPIMVGAPAAPFLYRTIQKQAGPLRPLPVLLQHESLFVDLHVYQSSILRAFCNRMVHLNTNCYLPNWSLNLSTRTSDIPILQTNNVTNETENTVLGTDQPASVNIANLNRFCIDSLNKWSLMTKNLIKDVKKQKSKVLAMQQIKNLKKQSLILSQSNDQDLFEVLLVNPDAVQNQNKTVDESAESFEISYKQSSNNIPSFGEIMEALTYTVIVGNQLIVRSNDINLANDICLLYMKLVPENSIHAAFNSTRIKKSYEANFVTIHNSIPLSNDIDYQNCALLDVTFTQSPSQYSKLQRLNLIHEGQVRETTLGLQVKQLYTKALLRYKPEVRDLASITDKENLERVKKIETCMLNSLKEEYLSKAKLITRAVRSYKGNPQSEQFFVNHLLQMVHLSNNDLPVLQNFTTGLSRFDKMS